MPLSQCEYCGEAFNNLTGQKICPKCAKELDEDFVRIRKYMYSTSDRITAARLVAELDVSEKAVDYLIREGRLILDRSGKPVGRCRICGAPAVGDQLCESCRKKFTESMQKYREKKESAPASGQQRPGSAVPLARGWTEKD